MTTEVGQVLAKSGFRAPELPDAQEAGLNVIHDPRVAASLGFSSALVGGVTSFALMVEDAGRILGEAWYENGFAEVRWVSPVYSGEELTVTTEVAEVLTNGASLTVRLEGPNGETRAMASCAAPRAQASIAEPGEFGFVSEWSELLPKEQRPDLALGTEKIGQPMRPVRIGAGSSTLRMDSVLPPSVGPAWFSGAGIELIRSNFNRPNPNIHVSSRIWMNAKVSPGQLLDVYGGFTRTYAKRGNRYIDQDVEFHDLDGKVVARVSNSFIYIFGDAEEHSQS